MGPPLPYQPRYVRVYGQNRLEGFGQQPLIGEQAGKIGAGVGAVVGADGVFL